MAYGCCRTVIGTLLIAIGVTLPLRGDRPIGWALLLAGLILVWPGARDLVRWCRSTPDERKLNALTAIIRRLLGEVGGRRCSVTLGPGRLLVELHFDDSEVQSESERKRLNKTRFVDGSLTDVIKESIVEGFRRFADVPEVAVNVWSTRRVETGHLDEVCIYCILADRATFDELMPEGLSGREFAGHFAVRVGSAWPGAVVPIDADGSAQPGVGSVCDLSPEEFERIVGSLLELRGYQISYTKRSGDGGIDVIAVNPEPVFGGRLVVQCKRYEPGRRVGVEAVRELYGVMQDERANKGLLVTTSAFTTAALRFADGKPLELVDGDTLARLMDHATT